MMTKGTAESGWNAALSLVVVVRALGGAPELRHLPDRDTKAVARHLHDYADR
jgi:hypothetical protein